MVELPLKGGPERRSVRCRLSVSLVFIVALHLYIRCALSKCCVGRVRKVQNLFGSFGGRMWVGLFNPVRGIPRTPSRGLRERLPHRFGPRNDCGGSSQQEPPGCKSGELQRGGRTEGGRLDAYPTDKKPGRKPIFLIFPEFPFATINYYTTTHRRQSTSFFEFPENCFGGRLSTRPGPQNRPIPRFSRARSKRRDSSRFSPGRQGLKSDRRAAENGEMGGK